MLTLLTNALILVGLIAGIVNLQAGLIILVLVGPFFTLLHEMSPGSPIFFLWPFALSSLMMLGIIGREISKWRAQKTKEERQRIYWVLAGMGALIVVLGVHSMDGLLTILTDVEMKEFRLLLANRVLIWPVGLMAITFLVFLSIYFWAMKKREGKFHPLDLSVGALLIYGLFQIGYTAYQNNVLFVGLDGFRYNFFMLIVYFLVRYIILNIYQEKQVLTALSIACIIGAFQIVLEGFLLNILEVPPENMPWVGHLNKNWGYIPESDRTFFEGGYRPLGLMYMTHFSGLFLLFGLALWLPKLWATPSWKDQWYLWVVILFVWYAIFWTSRTAIILFAFIFVSAAFLLRVGWVKTLTTALIFTIVATISSYNFLPGFRYDVIGEVKYILSGAVLDVFRAAQGDVLTVTGIGEGTAKEVEDNSPPGWHFYKGMRTDWGYGTFTKRIVNEGIVGNYALAIRASLGSQVWVRRVLENTKELRNKEILVGAWIKTKAPRLAWLSIDEYFNPTTHSEYHSGSGEWEFIAAKHLVHRLSESIHIDINVEHTDQDNHMAFLDGVYVVVDGKFITLMSHPQGFPFEYFPEMEGKEEGHGQSGSSALEASNPSPVGSVDATSPIHLEEQLKQEAGRSLKKWHHVILGRGASFWGWSALFFPKERESQNAFAAASHSDFKYLEFFEQFGLVGLILIILMGVSHMAYGLRKSLIEKHQASRATLVSLTLIVWVGFVGMIHYPMVFKVGLNSSIFLAMAIVMRPRADDAKEDNV
jgi:hypothetical protein